MTDPLQSAEVVPLHPTFVDLAETLARDAGPKVSVVRDDAAGWLAIEETSSTMAFAEVTGDQLRLVPFLGDAESVSARPYAGAIRGSWLDGQQELIVDASQLTSFADRGQVMDLMYAALAYWARSTEAPQQELVPQPVTTEPAGASEAPDVDFTEPAVDVPVDEPLIEKTATVEAHLRADISDQWSWASSSARIPQISDLTVEVAEPIAHARINVIVRDADVQFGNKLVFEGPLPAGTSVLGSVHTPLSARVMSRVEERHPAECVITLEDGATGRVLARYDEELDVQPRDLWLWQGDPRRSEQRARIQLRREELAALLQENPEGPDADALETELESLTRLLQRDDGSSRVLARSLLASFVRPNHPEIPLIAREAADLLGQATGDSSFFAFQIGDVAKAEERVDATVAAIYEALQARSISYSEPPPGWDYRGEGQRIRDHSDVAKAGLGTCMDTTVLTAAVIEQVGLLPVLVLIPGHIFVGYWRRDPLLERGPKPEWYPDAPVVFDRAAIETLIEGGWLGVIETTAFTVGKNVSASDARKYARHNSIPRGNQDGFVVLVDVAAARRAGVSPLPAVNERADGVTEIIEYRAGGAPAVTEVATESLDVGFRERQVDNHPARYRTWKSSLFSLNATNALLNLGMNARVQPLALPPEGLGILEDRLNQDVSFSLNSGYDIPEVWRARDIANAMQLVESGTPDDRRELLGQLDDRKLFIQRFGRVKGQVAALGRSTFFKEIRSMAHNAKSAYEERGMNPLFLCLGILRWPYKPGVFAEAPLILVPVNISVLRGRQEFTLSLDSSQQTTPNAALIEWLRREHGLSISGLSEPLADRAGIDVDGVLAEVRKAVAERGLSLAVTAEARLATLDLAAFRMWQDLNLNADHFFERPLVSHLVNTPTETFIDPAVETGDDIASDAALDDELETLETPIPADSAQKRAVLWARQGRTFVLQGPPGTGKSQTITNMVAECLVSGLRVLFVAEKGTALSVVQRRLESIGLGPFSLNLHHEGSNAAAVRAQLKRSLSATVTPDTVAMESARRQLRNARFELTEYPRRLHKKNAAGLSAYSAHDELLVLEDGREMPVPRALVAHDADQVDVLKGLFEDLQPWTSAAGVRESHPWRLAGPGKDGPFDVEVISTAVRSVLHGVEWSATTTDALGEALSTVTQPEQISVLAAASNPVLPSGDELVRILDPAWPTTAAEAVAVCERAADDWAARLHGFSPDVLDLDLHAMKTQFEAATNSGFLGRRGRQRAALEALATVAPAGVVVDPNTAGRILADLVAAQDAADQLRASLAAISGLGGCIPQNPFVPGALVAARHRLDQLIAATAALRDGGDWTRRVSELARDGHLDGKVDQLTAYADAWQTLSEELSIQPEDFNAWRGDLQLADVVRRHESAWRNDVDSERLVLLQRWCTLVRKLEPLRIAGLDQARIDLLEGRLPADTAEDALARGVAKTSLKERIEAEGLDRFDAVAHDQRVTSYSTAQEQVRKQWITDGPARMLAQRGGGGLGSRTGGLARELEKTTRKLGTRTILRKYGDAVQELTPLVLCSPSSVVDLIEPGVMEFDLVIFDEASQITVPEAIGALGRARAAVVVGDSKQMPPTRKVGGAFDEEGFDEDAEEVVEDQESILSESELARVPTLSLNWHYRSQDEALIAFSNRAYYRGELSSFPTPTLMSSDTGVEFRRVHWSKTDDKGMYLRAGSGKVELGGGVVAGSNTNPFEAVAVVRFIRELVHQSDEPPSVGIVTFNEPQRQLIEDLLNAVADSKIAEVMDTARMGRSDVLFVKALEQVQGDERDIVVFSVAFSKQANGRIPTNFGPLSNSGGERRLNVAVTRARRKNVVFCSFDPAELDVAGATYQGPKDLKAFLVFAKGAGSFGEREETPQRMAIRDRHRDEIAAALREAGLHVISDVGLSNFRLDLVLSRPETPERPLLPVLLDGESWKQRSTVSDRDVLPVEVLESLMGWPKVARIWWPMWLQNRAEVIARILSEVERAEARLTGASTTEEDTPEGDGSSATDMLDSNESVNDLSTPGQRHASAVRAGKDAAPPSAKPPQRVPSASDTAGAPTTVTELPDAATGQVDESGVDQPATGPTPDGITEFAPAHTNVIGSKEVLDELPDKKAAATVREQVVDVIETEGPIELTRLARLVARRFGLSTVRAARAEDIVKLIPRAQVKKSRRFGDFAWPADLDPETWIGFRTSVQTDRSLDEIAPEEIANAMLAVLAEYDLELVDDLLRRTAELFGITRLGGNVRSRLEAVYETLPTDVPEEPADSQTPPAPTEATDQTPEARLASDDGPRGEAAPAEEVSFEVSDVSAMLSNAFSSGDQGGFEVGDGYVQWQGDPVEGL